LLDSILNSTFISAEGLDILQKERISVKYIKCLIDVYKERANDEFVICIEEYLNTLEDRYYK
jgi:hypothetical protein